MDQSPNQPEENHENKVLNDANECNQLINLKFENHDDCFVSLVNSMVLKVMR